METISPLDDLGSQLSGLACLCSRIVTTVRKRHNLSAFEFHSLLALRTHHPCCVQALGGRLEFHKTKTSKVLRSLQERSLIFRTTDANDRRVDHISLSLDGEALADKILRELEGIAGELLEGLAEKERNSFLLFLKHTEGTHIGELVSTSPPTCNPPTHRRHDERPIQS
jgi:MarR family 2-MHQ and catechol resistance regulon transcriptional repressor